MTLELTIANLAETIPALRQENAVLNAALARLESEITLQSDNNQALRAENARLQIELDKARGDLKWTAYELDQCRARAQMMTWQDAAAVAVLNEGEAA